jgi:hypothetical protein
MRVYVGVFALLAAGLVLAAGTAGELKSGLDKKTGGAFQVKAITGGQKGTQLCYV